MFNSDLKSSLLKKSIPNSQTSCFFQPPKVFEQRECAQSAAEDGAEDFVRVEGRRRQAGGRIHGVRAPQPHANSVGQQVAKGTRRYVLVFLFVVLHSCM